MNLLKRERNLIDHFLSEHFRDLRPAGGLGSEEQTIIEWIISYVDTRFGRMKYILGLALDFAIVAQRLSLIDSDAKGFRPQLTEEDIFEKYTLITERGSRKANTLTLEYAGVQEGIRRVEESVANLFHALERSDYPSAYVYNTGQWRKYLELLVNCFKLSEEGRLQLCLQLINYGLDKLPANRYYTREEPKLRLFEKVVENYPRRAPGENAGLAYQAIAYGFLSADRPHLDLIADKVRTGSSRQKRFGDIDCYFGLDLETSVEVKDFTVQEVIFEKELGEFCRKVEGNQIKGIAFVKDVTDKVQDKIQEFGVVVLTQADLVKLVSYWDWHKQEDALQGMLHYMAHIEQNPGAVRRLLDFISEHDSSHDSLAFYHVYDE